MQVAATKMRRRDSVGPSDSGAGAAFFRTQLGWMGIVWEGDRVRRLTFGHGSRQQAITNLDPSGVHRASIPRSVESLVQKLNIYAEGERVDFDDVAVDLGRTSEFRRRVLAACRAIGYGETQTYADLARTAGSPRAARAVGNIMASNRVPLIIPCHRVVGCGNSLGGFSAPDGIRMKERLLAMETASRHEAI